MGISWLDVQLGVRMLIRYKGLGHVGIFSLMSVSVTGRTREIGVEALKAE